MRTELNQVRQLIYRAVLIPLVLFSCLGMCGCGKQLPSEKAPAAEPPDADLKRVARLLDDIPLEDSSVSLYSLNPDVTGGDQKKPRPLFHDYPVLGTSEIKGSVAKSNLVAALLVSIPEKHPDNLPACFNPRHGLRIVSRGATNDFVICFECLRLRFYGAGLRESISLYSTGQGVFDQELKSRRLPTAKKH